MVGEGVFLCRLLSHSVNGPRGDSLRREPKPDICEMGLQAPFEAGTVIAALIALTLLVGWAALGLAWPAQP